MLPYFFRRGAVSIGIIVTIIIVVGAFLTLLLLTVQNGEQSLNADKTSERISSSLSDTYSNAGEAGRFTSDDLKALETLEIPPNEVSFISEVRHEENVVRQDISQDDLEALPDDSRAKLLHAFESGLAITSTVATSATVYKIQMNNEEEPRHFTLLSSLHTIETDTDKISYVRIIDSVPKDIAESASRHIHVPKAQRDSFFIIDDDPLIAFDVSTEEIENNSLIIEYYIEGDVVDRASEIKYKVVGDPDDPRINANVKAHNVSGQIHIILLIFIILALAGLVYFVMSRHENHKK